MLTKKRILFLGDDPESAKLVEELQARGFIDHHYSHFPTKEAFARNSEFSSLDVALVSGAGLSWVSNQPGIAAVIYLAADEEEKLRLQKEADALWDVVPRSDTEAVALSIKRAVAFAELAEARQRLEKENAQAKLLLLKSQKSITMGRLLGSIAHEINNPLEAISNLLYLAQRNLNDPEAVARSLDLSERELERVAEITRQMLSFYREPRQAIALRVSDEVENSLALYGSRIVRQKIEVVRQFISEGRLAIFPGELRQVLSNLIANAIDAMPRGGKLIFRLRERRVGRPRLCLTIADTGVGMSAQELSRLGELFFTTKGDAGTGLGLWVSHQLINRISGSLRVRSAPGVGTCFQLSFPITGERAHSELDAEEEPLEMKPRQKTNGHYRNSAETARDTRGKWLA